MKRQETPKRKLAPTTPRPVRADHLARICGGTAESWNAWWHQDPNGTGSNS